MSIVYSRKFYLLFSLVILILTANYVVYHVSLPFQISTEEMNWVAIGSLFDLIIVVPILLLAMTYRKGRTNWKQFIAYFAIGSIAARLIIPIAYFESFHFITYPAIAMEGIILLMEIGLALLVLWRLPKIKKAVKQSSEALLFSMPKVISQQVSDHFIIRVIAQEFLIFYYAFLSWTKNPPTGENVLTLHKNTNMIAFYVMIIHAIIIETIGLHWWLHEKSVILSIILLVLNIYTIIYFIADIQALRLNPLIYKKGNIYLSMGITKRMTIPLKSVKTVHWSNLPKKIDSKTTIEFIAKDMETLLPHCMIEFHQAVEASSLFGLSKKYKNVAIRVDQPERLRDLFENLHLNQK